MSCACCAFFKAFCILPIVHALLGLVDEGIDEVVGADPLLGGDPTLHNPEDMLIATVSACHMLWYLHLASNAKIVVTSYMDNPVGTGRSEPDGTGRFIKAVLKPVIEVARGTDLEKADQIHYQIHNHCFIARSVNFPITYEASYREA